MNGNVLIRIMAAVGAVTTLSAVVKAVYRRKRARLMSQMMYQDQTEIMAGSDIENTATEEINERGDFLKIGEGFGGCREGGSHAASKDDLSK